MHIEVNSELAVRVEESGANPLTFVPMVNFARISDRCIVDAF
jgi:hypothetical protein